MTWTALGSEVDAMVADGSTNQTIGLVWGWHALSQGNPLNAPALPPNTSRYIIILSDGLNTQDRWYGNGSSQSNWRPRRPHVGGVPMPWPMDFIYALFVDIGGTQGNSTVLQNCASDASKYYDLTSASEISQAFNQIGQQITNCAGNSVVGRATWNLRESTARLEWPGIPPRSMPVPSRSMSHSIAHTIVRIMPYMAIMAVGFAALSWISPCNKGKPWWEKKGLVTDLCYWFIVPVFSRYARIGLAVLLAVYLMGINTANGLVAFFDHGHGPLSRLPFWWQLGLYLVASEFCLYWIHRAFHSGWLWLLPRGVLPPGRKIAEWTSASRFYTPSTDPRYSGG